MNKKRELEVPNQQRYKSPEIDAKDTTNGKGICHGSYLSPGQGKYMDRYQPVNDRDLTIDMDQFLVEGPYSEIQRSHSGNKRKLGRQAY